MQYLISVILPVFQVKKYLDSALESLKKQTIGFDNIQVIFVDDCSTDGSWEQVQQYAEQYPNVLALRLKENSGGCGEPRNEGMKHVQAPYVMFLDPDDTFSEDACQVLYNETESSGAEIATAGYDAWNEKGERVESLWPDQDSCDLFPQQNFDSASFTLPLVWAKIYKTEFLQKNHIGFEKGIPGEDQVFTVWCYLAAKKVRYVKHCVYHYLVRNEQTNASLSNNRNKKYFDGILICCKKCLEVFQKYHCEESGKKFVGMLLGNQLVFLQQSESMSREEKLSVLESMRTLDGVCGESVFGGIFQKIADAETTLEIFQQVLPLYEEKLSLAQYVKVLREEAKRNQKDLEVYKDWVSNQEKTIEGLHEDVRVYKTDAEAKQDMLRQKEEDILHLQQQVLERNNEIQHLQQLLQEAQADVSRIKRFYRNIRNKKG